MGGFVPPLRNAYCCGLEEYGKVKELLGVRHLRDQDLRKGI